MCIRDSLDREGNVVNGVDLSLAFAEVLGHVLKLYQKRTLLTNKKAGCHLASRFTKSQFRFSRTAPFIPEKQSANGHRNAQQSCACTSSCSCTSRSSCWRTYGASAELLPSVIKLSALYPYGFDLSIRFSNGKTRIGKTHKTLSHSGRGFCEDSFRICTQTSVSYTHLTLPTICSV